MLILAFLAWFGALIQSNEVQERSDYYRAQGEKLYDQEKYEESLVYYEKAFAEIEKTDRIRAANLCNDMSSVYYALQQLDQSISKCREGIALLEKSREQPDSLYFKLYSSLGTMFHNKTMADSSTYYFLLSDKLLKDNALLPDEIPEYVLHHYLNQGRSVWRKHRYYDSVEYFEKALTLSRKKKMNSELFYIYSSLAEVYDLLNQHDKALEWRFRALEQVPESREQSRQSLYTGVGRTYRLQEAPDSALIWFNKSLSALARLPGRGERYQAQYFYLLIELGNLHLQKGNREAARRMFARAEEFYRKHTLSNDVLFSSMLLSKGDFEKREGNLEAAMLYYERAYEVLLQGSSPDSAGLERAIRSPKYAIRALQSRAEVYTRRYEQNADLRDLEKAHSLYSLLISTKKESYRQVVSNSDDKYFYSADIRPVMEAAVHNGFEYYTKAGSDEALEVLFNRFEDANTIYLMDIISGSEVNSRNGMPGGKLALESIKKQMDDRSIFITYKLIDNEVIALLVTKRQVYVKKWGIDSQGFMSDLKSLLKEVKMNPGLGAYAGSEAAQRCYEALLKPIESWTSQYKRWIIVRDWKFSSLPFEILEKNAGQYLADLHAMAYSYSASFFWYHPVLQQQLPRLRDAFVFAPFARDKEESYTIDGWKPVSTPDEVKAMGEGYVLGEDATKQSFIEEGGKHYILNLATHAFADLKNPNSSYVQFYPGVDSKLYLEEAMSLKLNKTRLIMLSSCFGNEGTELEGEGAISLAYAFAQAGCPSLISTSWEANENTISFLTLQVAKYIEKGFPLDEAVQRARQNLRENGKYGKYDHPYFWANINLLGNHSPVYQVQAGLSGYWYILFLLILLGTGGILWKRKKYRRA